MDKDDSWRVIDAHRLLVADVLEGLDDEQWQVGSLCDGWRVQDVGAHLSLAATSTARETLGHAWRARFDFNRMIDAATRERGRRPPDEVVADLRGIVGSRRLAPTTMWRDPLLDVLVHSQDIALPLGIDVPLPAVAAREAAEWAWRRRFPFFAAKRLAGVRLVATDIDWARGDGAELRGPITSLLLLSTGRYAALPELEGPGREALAARVA